MVGASVSLMKILCTGDAFITPDAMVAALTSELGEGHEFVTSATNWPTDPFVFNDEVREFVGDEDILVDLVPGVDLLVNHVAPVTRNRVYLVPVRQPFSQPIAHVAFFRQARQPQQAQFRQWRIRRRQGR